MGLALLFSLIEDLVLKAVRYCAVWSTLLNLDQLEYFGADLINLELIQDCGDLLEEFVMAGHGLIKWSLLGLGHLEEELKENPGELECPLREASDRRCITELHIEVTLHAGKVRALERTANNRVL